jgi:hypothetical protein
MNRLARSGINLILILLFGYFLSLYLYGSHHHPHGPLEASYWVWNRSNSVTEQELASLDFQDFSGSAEPHNWNHRESSLT